MENNTNLLALIVKKHLAFKTFKKGVNVAEDGITAAFFYTLALLSKKEQIEIINKIAQMYFNENIEIKDVKFSPWHKIGKYELDGLIELETSNGKYAIIYEAKWNSGQNRQREDDNGNFVDSQLVEYYDAVVEVEFEKCFVLYVTKDKINVADRFVRNITWIDLARFFIRTKEGKHFVKYIEILYKTSIQFEGLTMISKLTAQNSGTPSNIIKIISELSVEIIQMVNYIENTVSDLKYKSEKVPSDCGDIYCISGALYNYDIKIYNKTYGRLAIKISLFNNDDNESYYESFDDPFVTVLFYPADDGEWEFDEFNYNLINDDEYSEFSILSEKLITCKYQETDMCWAFSIPLKSLDSEESVKANIINPVEKFITHMRNKKVTKSALRSFVYTSEFVDELFSGADKIYKHAIINNNITNML